MLEEPILQFFQNIQNVVSISIFGSHAKQKQTPQSDIDIAVLFEKQAVPPLSKIIDWREELGNHLARDVDLVCLNTASPILAMQVHTNGKILKIKNEKAYARYQMLLFSEYAELKEMRAPMEESILERKYFDGS